MSFFLSLLSSVLTQGLVYAILAMGVMLSYKILDFADLSVDGTFPLGGVVSAVMIVKGYNPWLTLLVAMGAGAIAGAVTGLLHVKLKIAGLLSGILVMTGLYSVNLFIGKSSNIPLYNYQTIADFPWADASWAHSGLGLWIARNYVVLILLLIVLALKLSLDLFLKTRLGYLMKVTGDNPDLISVFGHNIGLVKIAGLSLSNALVALSGAVSSSVGHYYDINFGRGMVVLGLASVILGTIILGKTKVKLTTMVISGAIVYRLIVALALRAGLDSMYLQLVTVLIFIIAISLNKMLMKGKGDSHA